MRIDKKDLNKLKSILEKEGIEIDENQLTATAQTILSLVKTAYIEITNQYNKGDINE